MPRARRSSPSRRSCDELEPRPHSVRPAGLTIAAVCRVPGGAHPSYAAGYSTRDNDFYSAWDDDRARPRPLPRLDARARPRGRRGPRMSVDEQPPLEVSPQELMTINAAPRAARRHRSAWSASAHRTPPPTSPAACRLPTACSCTSRERSGRSRVRLPLSIGDDDLADTALELVVACRRCSTTGSAAAASTSAFLGAAQIDPHANLNTTVIGGYDGAQGAPPRRRWGPRDRRVRGIGDRDRPPLAAGVRRAARLRHLAGPQARARPSVITDLGRAATRDRRASWSLSPCTRASSPADVQEATGWELRIADPLERTEAPSEGARGSRSCATCAPCGRPVRCLTQLTALQSDADAAAHLRRTRSARSPARSRRSAIAGRCS